MSCISFRQEVHSERNDIVGPIVVGVQPGRTGALHDIGLDGDTRYKGPIASASASILEQALVLILMILQYLQKMSLG